MITQQHGNEIQQRAQATFPVKEHLWRVALFSSIGVALPLVAGLMLWWPWGVPDIIDVQLVFYTIIVAEVVSVAVGAFLLCFEFDIWWFVVFAAVAWIIGEFLCSLERTLVESGWPFLQSWEPFWSGQVSFILVALMPLIVGMSFGGSGGLALRKRITWRKKQRHMKQYFPEHVA
jgi:hypothetical protein